MRRLSKFLLVALFAGSASYAEPSFYSAPKSKNSFVTLSSDFEIAGKKKVFTGRTNELFVDSPSMLDSGNYYVVHLMEGGLSSEDLQLLAM